MPCRPFLHAAGFAALLLAGGCTVVHEVTVDAISDRSRPLGATYHLEVNDPTGGVEPANHELAVRLIKDALAARGFYEVPAATRPDMEIEASYGCGHGQIKIINDRNADVMLGPGIAPAQNSKAVVVYDKTLEITARAPRDVASGEKPGPELWSIKARIADPKQDLAPYLPALTSACIDYIGTNPGRELVLPVDSANALTLLQRRPEPAATPAAK